MASVDVAGKLEHIEKRLDIHDVLHQQNTQILSSINDVLVNQARYDERMNHMSSRQEGLNAKVDKLKEKVETNTAQIMKWAGGIAAVITVFSIAVTIIKFFT